MLAVEHHLEFLEASRLDHRARPGRRRGRRAARRRGHARGHPRQPEERDGPVPRGARRAARAAGAAPIMDREVRFAEHTPCREPQDRHSSTRAEILLRRALRRPASLAVRPRSRRRPSPPALRSPRSSGASCSARTRRTRASSDPSVECVLQDHVGFLWAGTDDGLFRFDGRGFTKFSREQGLPQTRIYQLYETADGRLYAATARDWRGSRGTASSSSGQPGLGAFADQPPGHRLGRRGDRLRRHRSRALLGQGRPLPGGQGSQRGRRGRRRRRPRGRGGRALLRARRSALPQGVRTRRRVRAAARPAVGRDGRRGAVRPRRAASGSGPSSTSICCPRAASGSSGTTRACPSRAKSGRLAFDDRGRAARADGAGPRVQAGRRVAPDRTAGGPRRPTPRSRRSWTGRARSGSACSAAGSTGGWAAASSPTGRRSDGLSQEVVWAIARQKSASGPGALWVGTEQGLNRLDPVSGDIRRFGVEDGLGGNTVATPRGGSRRQRLDRLLAGRRHAPHAGRQAAALLGRGRGARTVSRGRDPRARGRRGLGRRRGGPLPAARRLEGTVLERVALGREKPDNVRGFAEDPAGTLYAASKQGILRLTGPSPRKFTRADGLKEDFLSSIAFASDGSAVVAYRESIGAARVIIEGDRMTVQADRRRERPDLEQGRPARARRRGRDVDRHRHRAPTCTPPTGRASAHYGKPDGDGQRGPRPERLLSPKPTGRSGSARAGA